MLASRVQSPVYAGPVPVVAVAYCLYALQLWIASVGLARAVLALC